MASPCRYTLVLRYDTSKFYLSPRASIAIDEGTDLEQLQQDQGCSTCGQDGDRTWKLKVLFPSCDLQSSWTLFNALQAFLAAGCENGDLTIERTVCNETPLVYQIKKAFLRMIDVNLQHWRLTPRVLSMELTLELTAWVEAGEGAVLVGA